MPHYQKDTAMEISREVLQDLMERIAARRPEKSRQKIKEEPEVYLVSLLLQIEEEIIDPRKAHHTPTVVEYATYESRVQQAREFLAQLSEAAPCS